MRSLHTVKPPTPKPFCGGCVHFNNQPDWLERALPGLSSFSSGHAAVRSLDGICERDERLRSAHFACAEFCDKHARSKPRAA